MESFSKKTTQTIELNEFFELIKYDFEQDFENIEEICKLTKTRPKNVFQEFFMDYGSEQPFLIIVLCLCVLKLFPIDNI